MAGEQAAAEYADVLPLDDAVTIAIAAGIEPALSALKYLLPTPPARVMVAARREAVAAMSYGRGIIGGGTERPHLHETTRRCSTTELPELSLQAGFEPAATAFSRRSNRYLRHRPNYANFVALP